MKMTKEQIIQEVVQRMVEVYFDYGYPIREIATIGAEYMSELMSEVDTQ